MRSSSTCPSGPHRLRAWPVAVAIGAMVLHTAHAMDPATRRVAVHPRRMEQRAGFPGRSHQCHHADAGRLSLDRHRERARALRRRSVPPRADDGSRTAALSDRFWESPRTQDGSLWIRGAGPTLRRYSNGAFSAVDSGRFAARRAGDRDGARAGRPAAPVFAGERCDPRKRQGGSKHSRCPRRCRARS